MRLIRYLAAALLFMSCGVSAGVTIHVEPGPHGGDRVITPWGDYIVVMHDDGSAWVGTEAEYDMGRVTAFAAQEGMKPEIVEGNKTFVSGILPSETLGSIRATNIDVSVLFGLKPNDYGAHRPQKPPNDEYVALSWTQSGAGKITSMMKETGSGKFYAPYNCGFDSGVSSGYCEFILPKDSLAHNFSVMLFRNKEKPSLLPLKSITAMHFAGLLDKKRHGTNIEGDDLSDLHHLHMIDPTIPNEMP